MYLNIKIPKDMGIATIINLVDELDKWVINYELDIEGLRIDILTIPNNKDKIKEIVSKYAKEYSTQRSKQ